MTYTLSPDGTMLVRSDGALIPMDPGNADYQAYLAWMSLGNTPLAVPAQSFSQFSTGIEASVQSWLDQTAQQNGYDSAFSCVSYKDSGVTQYAGDAQAMIAWRDAVWSQVISTINGYNGSIPAVAPTAAQFIAALPQPSAYGWVVHPTGTSSTMSMETGALPHG